MKSSSDILSEVKNILSKEWTARKGINIPETEDIQLGNDAVELNGTVLYADMKDSTELVNNYKSHFAAEIYKLYLVAACHIIANNNGKITAFDGDRVMAVFIDNIKNSSAAKTALQINYIVGEINKKIKVQYPNSSYILKQSIGIDTTDLFVARAGIRKYNDLVWIGRSANYAAKLCQLTNDSFSTIITSSVFERLSDSAKYGGSPRCLMWEKSYWQDHEMAIYKSNWIWKF